MNPLTEWTWLTISEIKERKENRNFQNWKAKTEKKDCRSATKGATNAQQKYQEKWTEVTFEEIMTENFSPN